MAPAAPGDQADWLPANKSGFGTSHTTLSKVWFTLEGGRLSEVYYPRLDTPSVRNLDFMITDEQSQALLGRELTKQELPSRSTVHRVLAEAGLVKRRRRRRRGPVVVIEPWAQAPEIGPNVFR